MKKGLLFGGAFNPPTKAHIDCAKYAMDRSGYDHVVFVPSKEIYIRYDQKKDFVYSDEDRLAMLQCIRKNEPWMRVSDYEILCDHQPRTYETLCALKQQGETCALLFGSDKLQEFSTAWMYPRQIAEEFGIVCMSRNGLNTEEIIDHDPLLTSLRSYIEIVEIPDAYQNISSSMLRNMLKEGRFFEAQNLLHTSLIDQRHLLKENIWKTDY